MSKEEKKREEERRAKVGVNNGQVRPGPMFEYFFEEY